MFAKRLCDPPAAPSVGMQELKAWAEQVGEIITFCLKQTLGAGLLYGTKKVVFKSGKV